MTLGKRDKNEVLRSPLARGGAGENIRRRRRGEKIPFPLFEETAIEKRKDLRHPFDHERCSTVKARNTAKTYISTGQKRKGRGRGGYKRGEGEGCVAAKIIRQPLILQSRREAKRSS